jgi:poly-gamma-glutamate synthesis protein (capsule biosynthesis protein)
VATSVELFFCGDVMTGRGIDQILPSPSEPTLHESYVRDARDYVELAERESGAIPRPVDFAYVWGDALAELRRAAPAARIVNLETAVTRSDDAELGKEVHYRMHPANVPCLEAFGVDVCVLANNHVLDWGPRGLLETLDTLHAAKLRTAGAGRTRAEAEAPAIVDLPDGRRVLVFGVGHASSGIPPWWAAGDDAPGVALLPALGSAEAAALVARVARARRPGDVVVVSIHWGSNWGHEIPDENVRFAHALVEGGIDVVHGHSSHHPRPFEIHRGKPIMYGCGDFLSDYEGIHGHEELRDDLAPMYFVRIDRDRPAADVRIVPMHLRKMHVERGTRDEGELLAHLSRRFGTEVVVLDDGTLVAKP